MTLKDDTPENRKVVDAYLDPLRAEVTPVASGLFAGRLDYSRLGFFTRLVAKHMANAPEGDYRDWPAIERWAEEIATIVIIRDPR
jgi:menaquinone-dependent protoporphyrinogen oxidase